MRQDDLARLFHGADFSALKFHQGEVISFDLSNGNNIVRVGGTQMENLPVMNVTDSAGLLPGHVVGVLQYRSQFFIIGRVAKPGTSDHGDITVRSNQGASITLVNGEVRFRRGNLPDESYGSIFASSGGSGVEGRTFTQINSPSTIGNPSDNRVVVEGRSLELPNGAVFLTSSGSINVNSGFGDGDTGGNLNLNARSGSVTVRAYDGIGRLQSTGFIGVDSFNDHVFINAQGGSVWLNSQNNATHIEHATTGAGANCHIGGDGRIWRSTSSRRYKDDIQDLVTNTEDILKLRPRTWTDKGVSPDPSKRHVGFIAEELDEIGLGAFVDYNEENQPDAIAYDRISAALITVIKKQQEQINELTNRVEALEDKNV